MVDSMIEVAYAIHDYSGEYTSYLWISMKSLLENTREKINFHILCDHTLLEKNRDILEKLCQAYGQNIKFYQIFLDQRLQIDQLLKSGYNEGILFRLYLPELFPTLSKMIYLDADLLFCADIKELWEIDVSDVALAGRWDPPVEGYRQLDQEEYKKMMSFWENCDWNSYVNSGVLIMNLDRMRAQGSLMDQAITFFQTYGMAFPDQDVINFVFQGQKKLIPYQYNIKQPISSEIEPGCIYHYEYRMDEWKFSPRDQLFLKYWEQSPFFRPEYGKKEKIFYLRRLKSRLELYERLEAMRSMDFRRVLYKAIELYQLGRYQECCEYLWEEHWKEGLTVDELQIESLEFERQRIRCLASALWKLDFKEDAIQILTDFLNNTKSLNMGYISRNIEDLRCMFLLGELHFYIQQYGKAEEIFLQCLFFGNQDKWYLAFRALHYAAVCAVKQNALSKAMEYIQRMLVLDPQNLEAKIMRIKVSHRLRKNKEKTIC